MKKFVLLYRSGMSAEEQMKNGTPEDAKKMMDVWMAWFQKAGSAVVDAGAPLGSDTDVDKTGNILPHAGDYVGGYSVIQADTMDTVKAMLSDHPHFMQEGNTIEILEVLPMAGM